MSTETTLNSDTVPIRVVLPPHLRTLARVGSEVTVPANRPASQRSVIDALEAQYPMLGGTIRDHVSRKRRPFLRFFVCGEDWTFESDDAPLPELVQSGVEPFFIVGAVAGG